MAEDSTNDPGDSFLGELCDPGQILDTMLEAVISIDDRHRIVQFNRGAESLLGWLETEILGQPLTVILPDWAHCDHAHHVAAFDASGSTARLMHERDYVAVRHREGHEIPVEASIMRNQGARAPVFTAILRDVRRRLKRESELRRSEARLANVQRMAQIGSWERDLESGQCFWSDAYHRVLGYRPNAVTPGYRALLDRVHPEDRARVAREIDAATSMNRGYEIDYRIVRPDGVCRAVEERSEVIVDTFGRPAWLVGAMQDVTERWHRAMALEAAKLEAERADRAKSEFLAAISHELRTPLNAIIGFSEFIKGDLLGNIGNPRYREYAGDILESGHLLLGIVNDMLDITRVESGRIDLEEEPVSVATLTEACCRLAAGRARNACVDLRNDVAADLPPIRVDPRLIKQILINLLSNAIKFTPEGGRVSVGAERTSEGDVVLCVRDTGIGIPLDSQEAVFEPFVQHDSGGRDTLYQEGRGLGLGLALVKTLADAHGARVTMKSAPKAGTEMRVIFPAWRVAPLGSEDD